MYTYYRVTDLATGLTLGRYRAWDGLQALDYLAEDIGYPDYKTAVARGGLPEERDLEVVAEVAEGRIVQ